MSKFVDCARDQAFLLPPDLRDWVPEDDLAHFVIEAVERVGIDVFEANARGTGSAQYHPRMMLALLIYCYANGIFSSRRIERATHRDIGVRYVAANQHPDHDTIATFRRRNFQAVAESFLQVLLLARELKLLKLGVVSVDGSKLDANASKHRSVTYRRAGELVDQLKLEIAELMGRAEAADTGSEADPQALPKEIGRLAALRAKLDAARQRLEAQAKVRAAAERADYEAKVAVRESRTGRAKGKHPKPPDDTPGPHAQSNLSDPDSRLMRKSKNHEYRQAYHAQAVVDAEGSQLILGARVSQCASDRGELVATIEAIPASLGRPEMALADNGYAHGAEVESLAKNGSRPWWRPERRAADGATTSARPNAAPGRRSPGPNGSRPWRRSSRASRAGRSTNSASRPSSRCSASSRPSSASPASRCAAGTRSPGSGTSWPWPTTASACTSSSWRRPGNCPSGPAIRPEDPPRPKTCRTPPATLIRPRPPSRHQPADGEPRSHSAPKSKRQARQAASPTYSSRPVYGLADVA
jgi:transposase